MRNKLLLVFLALGILALTPQFSLGDEILIEDADLIFDLTPNNANKATVAVDSRQIVEENDTLFRLPPEHALYRVLLSNVVTVVDADTIWNLTLDDATDVDPLVGEPGVFVTKYADTFSYFLLENATAIGRLIGEPGVFVTKYADTFVYHLLEDATDVQHLVDEPGVMVTKYADAFVYQVLAPPFPIGPILSNVAVTNVSSTSATVTWETDEAADSLVKYGTASESYTLQKYDPANVTAHSVDLSGLMANTTYYFVVNSTNMSGNASESDEYTFSTTPGAGSVVTVEDGDIGAVGATTEINITLSTAPDGLSGYNLTISLSNADIAEILAVEFPAWATIYAHGTLPADAVWLKAVDMMGQVDPGATNVLLATLTIRGDAEGESTINAVVTQMDPDGAGEPIAPSVDPGHLTVISVVPLPGYDNPPTDPDGDGLYEDLNGNGGLDFDDVVQLFKHLEWIEANEPNSLFDFNGNGRLDFDDIVRLFKEV